MTSNTFDIAAARRAATAAASKIWPVAGDPATQGGQNGDPRTDSQSGWSRAFDGFMTAVEFGIEGDEYSSPSTAWEAGFNEGLAFIGALEVYDF